MEHVYLRDSPKPAGHYSPGVVHNGPRGVISLVEFDGNLWRALLMRVSLLLLLSHPTLAQDSPNASSKVLLDPNKAPVYLEFVRSGTCKKDFSMLNSGDLCSSKQAGLRSFDAVWLRLVNNTRWSVGLRVEKGATEENAFPVVIDSTAFTGNDGEKLAIGKMVAKDGAEMDVVYKSESETGCDFHKKAPKGQICFRRETVPPQIPLPGMSTDLFVAPGQSIVFPVDLAHVKEYVNLYVLYNFSWEYSSKPHSHSLVSPAYDTQHRAYFGWFDIQKGLGTEKDRRKASA